MLKSPTFPVPTVPELYQDLLSKDSHLFLCVWLLLGHPLNFCVSNILAAMWRLLSDHNLVCLLNTLGKDEYQSKQGKVFMFKLANG